jgi:hypothetical protein
VGWVQAAAVVNERTGFVVDGHLRVALSIARDEPVIPVCFVNLTPAEEDLILASFDSISGAAVTDGQKLDQLLGGIGTIDPMLNSLFADLLEQGKQTNLLDVDPAAPAAAKAAGAGGRGGGNPAAQIKPVLYAPQLEVFERAIRAANEPNRGAALIQICEFFLAHSAQESANVID